MNRLIAAAVLAGAIVLPVQAPRADSPAPSQTDQIHQDLRALKDRLVAAVNRKDEAALLADLDKNVRVTTMDNHLSSGHEGVSAYFRQMMVGSNRVVEDMSVDATPDDLATLFADGKIALATGSTEAHMKILGGRSFDVPLRWTASLENQNGAWKVTSTHFSADMFDNPVLAAQRTFAYWLTGGTGVIGVALGWFLGRRRKAK